MFTFRRRTNENKNIHIKSAVAAYFGGDSCRLHSCAGASGCRGKLGYHPGIAVKKPENIRRRLVLERRKPADLRREL